MTLTETQIKRAKPESKIYKLTDGLGLNLEVRPSGLKVFTKAYRFQGKQRTETLGEYPGTKLSEARQRATAINQQIKDGVDPRTRISRPGKVAPIEMEPTEVPVERQWRTLCLKFIEKRTREGIAPATVNKLNWNLGKTIHEFRDRDVGSITGQEILALIERTQDTGKLETAKDIHRKMSQVFQYAAGLGLVEHDPTQLIKRAIIKTRGGKHPGLTRPEDVGGLMRAIRGFKGEAATRAGLLLSAYTVLRSTELRGARWREIDFDAKLWTVPGERMKGHYGEHIIPLSTQALGTLEWLHPWTGGDISDYVFQCSFDRTRHMSNATLNAALRRLGYDTRKDHCQHGFRTTFSTTMNEMEWNKDWIERQLNHVDADEVRSAYNRAKYLKGRTALMQAYCDWLDEQERKV